MSIEEKNIIDFVSINKENQIVLTISDHLNWDNEDDHLVLLNEKINTYCIYVENGQLYDEYQEARDLQVLILIVFFNKPTRRATNFLSKVSNVLTREGVAFKWEEASPT